MYVANSNKCVIIDRVHEVCEFTLNGRKQYIVDRNDKLSSPVRRHVYSVINDLNTFDWSVLSNHFDKLFDGEVPVIYDKVIGQLSV